VTFPSPNQAALAPVPQTCAEATQAPDADDWREAILSELDSLRANAGPYAEELVEASDERLRLRESLNVHGFAYQACR